MSKMIVNIAVFGAFVLMVFFLGFFLWQTLFASEENSEAESQPKVTYSQKQTGNEKSFRTSTTPSITNPSDKAIARYTKWLAIFTLFLVLATVALFISGERSVQVANRSADAANRSARIATESLFTLQRAFVGVRGFQGLSHLNPTTGKVWWSFHTTWENSGASPTKSLRFYIGRYLENVDIPPTFKFDIPEDIKRPIFFLGPRATLGGAEIHVEGDDLLAVQNGSKFLYLWGRADYRDLFDGTPDHVTKFFVKIDIRGDPTKVWDQNTNIVEFIFGAGDRHNCADEDCNEQQ
ncbi:MAG: hypothetical protein ACLPSW_18160 [Roseiarcus sp.]